MSKPLTGKRILVTRPTHQAGPLTDILQAKGADVSALPMLAIKRHPECSTEYALAKSKILDLDLYHSVIFISPNSAQFGAELIDQYWPQLPIGVNWLAIGQRTAEYLADFGITAFHSDQGYDSTALLSSSLLSEVAQQKILIIRGNGGREMLANTLRDRGAQVDYAELYQRSCPHYDEVDLAQALSPLPNALLITSAAALENLQQLAVEYLPKLKQQLLIVPSERIASLAKQQRWQQIRVSTGPSDLAMTQALIA